MKPRFFLLCFTALLACSRGPKLPQGAEVTSYSENKEEKDTTTYHFKYAVGITQYHGITQTKVFSDERGAKAFFEKNTPQRPLEKGNTNAVYWARSDYGFWLLKGREYSYTVFLPPSTMTWEALPLSDIKKAQQAIHEYFQKSLAKLS